MQTLEFIITGTSPLLQHNERLANPTDKDVRELKKLTGKRGKTEDDLETIKRVEWQLGMYRDKTGPIIPADWVWRCIVEGARKSKLGRQAEAGVFDAAPGFPIEYEGPRDLDGMYADGRFVDYRGVGNKDVRVMRARPVFPQWSAAISVLCEESVIEPSQVRDALTTAGLVIGIGDYRPRFGRFSVEG